MRCPWLSCVILIIWSIVLPKEANQSQSKGSESIPFEFTQSIYNASVSENSMGSTLVLPTEKMGVWNHGGRVKLEIVEGDPLKLFRVEEKEVGIFCFLIIRVNNNERSLNREFKDIYKLRVRATLYEVVFERQNRTLSLGPPQSRGKDLALDQSQSETQNVVSDSLSEDGGSGKKSLTTRTTGPTVERKPHNSKVTREVGSGGSILKKENENSNDKKRGSGISRLHHYLDLTSPPSQTTTERQSFLIDSSSWSTGPGKNESEKDIGKNSNLKLKSKLKNQGRKALRRNSRDERRSKTKNKTKSGERRKNRKEKQIFSPIESNVPIPITLEPTTTSTTTPPPPIPTPKMPKSTVKPLLPDFKLIPIATTDCIVFIQILDQPDNGPLFEQRTYDVTVLEDIPIMSKITKIVAVDADIGRNQEIYYSLAEWNSYFAVDPILGILSPTRPLIGMVDKRQHIRIQAKNRWSSGPAAETTSILTIRPANRQIPQIIIDRPTQVETRPYGVIYAMVSCRDNDEGRSGLVDVTIKEGDPNGIFRILPASSRNEFYVVMSPVVAKSLNFKGPSQTKTYNLTLHAQDGGQPPKSSEKELQLKVSESSWASRDSSTPALFDKDLYEVEISESSPPKTVVFRFPRPHPKVTLSISSGNEGEEFKLEKSGVLYTSKWLDFERKSIFTLTVDSLDLRPVRMDQIRRPRSAVKIIIKLIDENKFWPVFDPTGNKTEVFFGENEPLGTLVTRVHARDYDQGENGYVTYSLANLNNLPFSIDHFTGEIRSLEVLDYETSRRFYTARLRATDWGLPFRRESEMKLQISLLPVNDNRPLFIYSNCVSVIDRRISFETEFGRVVALDFDHDVVTYKIVHGNSDSCFSIDSSGSLRVMCDLRDFRSSKRVLNLTASDGEYYSDVMSIKIELRDTLRTNFNKSESPRIGIKLYSTSHSVFECQDTGVQGRYDRMAALSEENNKMEVSDLDEENSFPALPSHYTENTQPQFLDFAKEIRVNESVEVGTRVVKLKAVDRDKGYNAFLKFVISSGDESHGAWDIISVETTSWTGATVQEAFLVVARSLDREEFSFYNLNISVFDQGKPPRSMSKLLPIKILDENDNAPQFLKAAMKIRIREGNELVGETIIQVKADDEDEEGSLNSVISYRLPNETFHNFSIDGKSGKVRLLGELDREKVDRYEILIVAEDNGEPKKSSTAVLTILVEDRNDQSPTFLTFGKTGQPGKSRVVKIREDWPLYSVVTRVVAEDEDLGEGGKVRYALVDGSHGDFVLDDISGVLRIHRKLDYQRTSMYNLTIQAKDCGTPSLSTETFLVVEIYDVEDSQPRLSFPELVTVGSVKEGAPVGSFVKQITPISFPQLSYPSVYFSLEGSSQFLFSIDSSGIVRTVYELDYETQPHWHYLTVVAQSSLDMTNMAYCFLVIELENENDCVPLTTEPSYLVTVEENLESGFPVLRLQGFDCDNSAEELRFGLRSWNSFFEIHPVTGLIRTTVSLDREEQSEHALDIILSDLSTPSLNSSTKVIISVGDVNDHIPRILQFSSGSVYDIPELKADTQEQDDEAAESDNENDVPVENEETEFELKWSDWRMMDVGEEMAMAEGWRKIFRVVGYDPDAGLNGTLQYRLKYRVNTGELRRDDEVYSIHPQSGEIYTSASGLRSDTILKFIIEVADNNGESWGSHSETEMTLRVKSVEKSKGSKAPVLHFPSNQQITVTTREKPGYTVETLEATDPEGDQLWYELVSGDPEQFFIIFPDSQNLILARPIPTSRVFRLNVSVSDGFNFVFTQLLVKVIESNEVPSALIWEQQNYTVGISESTPPFSVVATVRLNGTSRLKNSGTPPLYGFHNAQDLRSLRLFSIDSVSGVVRTTAGSGGERIDRETIPLHIITVKARDSETHTFVRLLIKILDENDKAPVFGAYSQTEVRIPETMALGSLVTQVFAYDGDFGENGILKYSIIYGNIGNTFTMESHTGRIFLRRELNIPTGQMNLEYQLSVRATDSGTPPLSATTTVTVIVTLPSDNQVLSLLCENDEDDGRRKTPPCSCTVHIKENSPPETFVTALNVLNSLTGVSFEIEENRNNIFWIDSATGVILVGKVNLLDREIKSYYDFSVKATNAQGVVAICRMKVLLDDENDSVPMFTNQLYYEGYISEDAPLGTLVLESVPTTQKSKDGDAGPQTERNALVFRSIDYDTGRNAIVSYSFVEDEEMRRIFYMDPSSGALLLVTSLDYEKRQFYNFQVRVCDFQFCDPSLANVTVRVENVNDQEPVIFSASVELLLPTAAGVVVHVLEALDPDGDELKFRLLNSLDTYDIESKTGRILVRHPEKVTTGKIGLEVSVSDGRFTKAATVSLNIRLLQPSGDFGFTNLTFETSFVENSTKIANLVSLPVSGTHLNENLQFTILNPTIYFGIMKTSGVVVTTGNKLDREHQSQHNLLVEVRGDEEHRLSRCFVKISVSDVNDNAPFFLNLPYIAVVVVNSKPGDSVIQVKAQDLDASENGVVRYELVRSPFGDIYDLNKQSGEIFLRRKPELIGHHELIVKAYDLGLPSLQTETQVQIKVVSHDQPVFEHQFYETWLPESAPLQSTALALIATAKHPVIFSIEGGNDFDAFGIDYQTGVLYVNAPLDFETTPIHLLKIKATDLITSFWSTTMVQINLKDSNDEIPKPEKATFVFHVIEGHMPSKGVLGTLTTRDGDEGVNALLTYEIETTAGWRRGRPPRSSDTPDLSLIQDDKEELMMSEDATSNNRSLDISQLFLVTPNDGVVVLKQVLDYEYAHDYYFSVIVRDSGIPSLSSTTRVVIHVLNINDNAPSFSKSLYTVRLAEDAVKGQTVAKVSAMDLDNLDALRYAIVGDYHKHTVFAIDKSSGIVTLLQPQVLQTELRFTLNISVTDGVFTSYTRLQITIQPKNHVVPTFDLSIYEVLAPENSPDGFLVTTLTALDKDRGIFGEISYSFSDMDEPNLFQIDERNGEVRLSSSPDLSLDREYKESHVLQVVAQDGGKWIGYTKLVVKVEKRKSSPMFPVSEYRVTIPVEKMKSKTPILQAVAIDSDSEFGIRYSIEDLPNRNLTMKRDSQYFEINGENGDLRFKLTEEELEKFGPISIRLDFQFWVRADDGELHSLVPVMVVVLPGSEPSPEIYPQNATFFLKEDASVGSIVTTFRVSNIDTPKFRVVSSNEDLFQVDPNGNLVLSALLDQDEDKHTVVVWAQNSDQGNVATSQVTIRVLATYSNKPKFNQPEYHLSVAEDFPEGSLVFTARAVDSDKGGNIKERYELQSDDPATDLFHFGINQEHGWITLLNKLDYEKHRQHILRVVASDSDNPSVTSAATVIVNVLNLDDEPSLFDSSVYYVEVREDITENSIIKVLRTLDLDEENGNSTITAKYLDFYIVEGDGNSHFKINEQGEISIWRKLDAELQDRFELSVLATDGKNLDYTNVTIKVLDVNDNVPVCPNPELFQELSEGSPNSTYVTVIEAYDPDKEARSPLFDISGLGSEKFRIDPESGILSVSGTLDRETQATFSLTVHARDRVERNSACRVRVRISLLDENDNAPVWRYTGTSSGGDEVSFYKFSLKEDSLIGTFVGKVTAQDADLGQNSRIQYFLVSALTKGGDLAKDQFAVEKKSGVISLLRPLDREIISEYNLTVKGTDAGSQPLSAVVTVIIQVLDINDNPPDFLAGSYSVAVSELAGISTEVVIVRATSKDEGVNAEITYDIVGGNGYFHWAVDPKSGVISSNATLDYERIREYILTVRARDGPPENQLASQCTVNISIIDENDNVPQFSQESYSVSIPEDLVISSSVIQIAAADLDTGLNAQLKYQFGYGDPMHSFRIHSSTGLISVASILDREMIPYYTLEVIATDSGSPIKSSSCLVEVQILDVNDSPPLFSKENYTAIVQEDRVIGYKLITFEVSDADSPPNSIPFSWDLKSLDEEEKGISLPFTVSDAGSLIVAGKLNFRRKPIYELQVKVFDNGTPPLESVANVTIQVVDKSQWPPVISSLTVTAVTLGDTYPPGILGVCHASDFDSFDVLTYSLLTTKSSSFFTIDHLNGTLYNLIPLREGTYELGVDVSDGRWSSRNDAYVKIISIATPFPDIPSEQLTEELRPSTKSVSGRNAKEMNNFILMSVSGHNRQSLLNRMSAFKNVIKEAVSVDSVTKNAYEVIILSVQSSVSEEKEEIGGDGSQREKRETQSQIPAVDVLFSVKRTSDGRFTPAADLIQQLRFALPQIEGILSAKVTRITADICKNSSCDRGTCRTVAIFEGTQSLITTETLSLITPNHNLETICTCPVGYGGNRCENIVNACAHSDCAPELICVPDESEQGFACLCSKMNCSGNNCEDQCSQQSVSFSGTSLLSYNVGETLERELSIYLRIKTLYTSGTLLYTAGEFDYAVLEINQGLVQFSWDLGTGKEVLTVTSISVSDNRWHQIILQLRGSYAILRVNERSTQRQKSQGPARILHTNGIFHIGSKLIGSHTSSIESQIPSQGFIGCMKDLRFGFITDGTKEKSDLLQTQTQEVKHYINTRGLQPIGIEAETEQPNNGSKEPKSDEESQGYSDNFRMNSLPLHSAHFQSSEFNLIFSRNISFSCAKVIHFVEACRSLPCKNGGTCHADSTPNGYACTCHSRFHGLNCEIDLEPCGSTPCLNSGKCRPTSNGISFSPSLTGNDHPESQFYCQCVDDGTYGSRCQSGKFCKNSENIGESEICNHRGDCEDGPAGPICWCENGYTGPRCQFDYDECQEGGDKICGPGSKCVNFLGGFRCLCPSNASGVLCQKVLTTPSIVTNDYQIIILILTIILSFIALLVTFIFVRRCCIARSRSRPSNSIPLTTSQVKVQDNRIGRDNREQMMRNRDSKISNLEVRPVSAGSEIFQAERVPLDGIKNYGPTGDELERPQFINNLMKPMPGEKKRSGPSSGWDTNRDDYPKIQNYMKGEISWGTKGSKPSSPEFTDASLGYHWEGYQGDPHAHPANISPIRTLPPPPDIPDSLSLVSHDSNNEVPPINLSFLPPFNDSRKDSDGLMEDTDDGEEGATGVSEENKWPIPHPDAYLLPHSRYSEDDQELMKPIVLRNRYQEKGIGNSNHKDPTNQQRRQVTEDEINENCSLLCGTPFPAHGPTTTLTSEPPNNSDKSSTTTSSPRKRFSSSSIFPMKSNGRSSTNNKHNYSKTTHVTEV